MQLLIVAVGHKMPAWIEAGYTEYAKRMPSDCRLQLKELKPVDRSGSRTAETVMAMEKSRIEEALPKNVRLVVLDERGKDLTTLQLSQHLTQWRQEGGDVAFIIGGADGLDAEFKKKADLSIRLSSMTLPHGMVRVLLAEQLYRAWSITQNHPYHRA